MSARFRIGWVVLAAAMGIAMGPTSAAIAGGIGDVPPIGVIGDAPDPPDPPELNELCLPNCAKAGSIATGGGGLTVDAKPGYLNEITVEVHGSSATVTDMQRVEAGPGCTSSGLTPTTSVECELGGDYGYSVSVNAGDLDDEVTAIQKDAMPGGQYTTLTGGSGDDVLTSQVNDYYAALEGGPGDDVTIAGTRAYFTLHVGGSGNDVANGSSHYDIFYASSGADTYSGGSGRYSYLGKVFEYTDLIHYDSTDYAHSGIVVTLDNAANDGVPGEADNVKSDVERVVGTGGADTIVGTKGDAANYFGGQGGNDTLVGGAGEDTLDGMDGHDTLNGGAGNDVGSGLQGGPGPDEITGGPGKDEVAGGEGDDLIDARDGIVDFVTCGGGSDTAYADTGDRREYSPYSLTPECETVNYLPRPSISVGSTGTGILGLP